MSVRTKVRSHVFQILLAAALTTSGAIPAFATEMHRFDVPVEDARDAIREFAAQARVQIAVAGENVKDKRLHAVTGEYSTEKGLQLLLADSGLTPRFVGNRSIAIVAGEGSKLEGSQAAKGGRRGQSETDSFRLAQANPQKVPESSSVEKSDSSRQDEENQLPQDDDHAHTPEILVKGSRVFNVDVTRTEDDVQPYYILDSKQIKQSGAVNVEDFLKGRLPMNTTIQSRSQFVSQIGTTSTINLRGLGTNETLVLIDGRRSASIPFAGKLGQPDINAIPLAAIERIEVLPSSASAIYGGAAMGGVVNVILKKEYQGGDIAYSYANTFRGHAPINTVSGAYGLTLEGGKTRIMLSGQYSDATPLHVRDRPELTEQRYADIIARDPGYFSSSPSQPYLGGTPNIGSADGHTGLTLRSSGTALGSPIATIAHGASAASPSTIIPGQWNSALPPTAQKFGLLQPLGAAPTTKSLMASLHRDLGSHLSFFTEFSTQSNSSTSTYNPMFGSFAVPARSPVNPFGQAVSVSIPNTADAPYLTNSVSRSVTVGTLARISADWSSEVDYTWSKSSFSDSYAVNYDSSALSASLANGTIDPFVDTIAHPLNLTPYLAPTHVAGAATLNDVGLRISGSLWSLPGGRPTLTVGLEHRKEGSSDSNFRTTYELTPSSNVDMLYFAQSQSTNSVYAEAQVPIVGPSNAIPLIHSVDLQVAGRSERYTVNARTPFAYLGPDGSVLNDATHSSPPQGISQEIKYTSTNPTIGLKYRPIDSVTFRASFAKAFLPPTSKQLLPNPSNSGTLIIADPANGKTYSVFEAQGGNPNLQPQTARDWDFGVILEPQMEALKGLRLNVEYYRITQPNFITTPSAPEVLANSAYANRVTRDPQTGLVTALDLGYLNATEFRTAGWDFTVDYQKTTAIGELALHAVGTVIDYDKRQYTISGPSLDYAGFPAELGEAKLKGNATLSWSHRAWALAWTATYFGSYKQGYGPADSPYALQYGSYPLYIQAQGGNSIPAQTYHDLVASYDLRQAKLGWISALKFQLGVKNVFNKVPPLDALYTPYLYSPYGDPRLREYWLGASARF